jgi:hypothetical protein
MYICIYMCICMCIYIYELRSICVDVCMLCCVMVCYVLYATYVMLGMLCNIMLCYVMFIFLLCYVCFVMYVMLCTYILRDLCAVSQRSCSNNPATNLFYLLLPIPNSNNVRVQACQTTLDLSTTQGSVTPRG